MSYPIRSREYHEAELRRPIKNRVDQDIEECALSNWSDGAIVSYHRAAISVIEVTERAESSVLVDIVPVLIDAIRGQDVEAKLVGGKFGAVWLLSLNAASRLGRKFIPFGKNSRVQKDLGLKQEQLPRPVKPYFQAHCAGVGLPVGLSTVRAIPESWGI